MVLTTAMGGPQMISWLMVLFGLLALGVVVITDDKTPPETDEEESGEDREDEGDDDEGEKELPSDPSALQKLLKAARAELGKVKQESAGRRVQLRELKKKAAEKPAPKQAEGDPADAEKLKQEVATQKGVAESATAKARRALIRSEIVAQAAEQRFQKTAIEDAVTLILANPEKYEVEVDDEDESVSGVEDALKAMVKTRPFWVKPTEKSKAPDLDAEESGKGKLVDQAAVLEKKRREYEPM